MTISAPWVGYRAEVWDAFYVLALSLAADAKVDQYEMLGDAGPAGSPVAPAAPSLGWT